MITLASYCPRTITAATLVCGSLQDNSAQHDARALTVVCDGRRRVIYGATSTPKGFLIAKADELPVHNREG